jgi:hydroxymethylglutaryl-CoA lyase
MREKGECLMLLPEKVTLIEVGPRDGLQNEKNFIPTDLKIQFIQSLKQAGLKEMELTSFVSSKWVPQMQDASEIVSAIADDGHNLVLTPNEKGIQRALEFNCHRVAVFVGVSNTFNQKNINKTTRESMEELIPFIKDLKEKGIFVRACISTSFYCPYEGKVNPSATLSLCNEFVEAGVDELSVADTIGMATPLESYSLFHSLKEAFGDSILLTAHFHDTRKMALANVVASMEAGIDRFDTSAGGLGGCPFAPGASGNVSTEDVAYMLERMNIDTGVNLSKLVEAIRIVEPYLSGKIDTGYYKLNS